MLSNLRKSIFRFTSHQKIFCQNHLVTLSNQELDTKIQLCVIGNGAEGNPRSLFISYHGSLFMFNCGEGVQRSLSDFKFKSSKIKTLFLTSKKWENISGFSSVLLARYDAQIRDIQVFDQRQADFLKKSTIFDTKLRRINFRLLNSNIFCHEKLKIEAISLADGLSTVFLGKLESEKGKINLNKCFNLKVPRNLVHHLQQGECVEDGDGQLVQPSDVSDPDQPERNFMIFEFTDQQNYLDLLQSNDAIQNILPKCDCIVHFTMDQYIDSPNYQSFMKNYSNAYHLLITGRNPSMNLYSAHRFQTQLNYLDSELFPLLKESTINEKNKEKILYCQSGLSVNLHSSEDSKDFLTTEKVFSTPTIEESLLHKDGTERVGLKEIVKSKKQSSTKSEAGRKYPEFVFLGTASSVSLPIRNVSGILVNLSSQTSILMDCGENTYGQLIRFYGRENIAQVLKRLRAIIISHHHSDHHMGLIQLLEKHRQHVKKISKISIVVPPLVHKFLSSNTKNDYLSNHHLILSNHFESFKKKIQETLNINAIDLIPVSHCAFAYGLSITDHSNFKFVYSGDTQPCETLIKRGFNCDLLIHEATVEDSLVHFARNMFHSTMSEAIEVGKLMQAKFTMLTHFSQRYGKLPFFPADCVDKKNIGFAFDHMCVRPDQFEQISQLHDSLRLMFSKHIDNIEFRTDIYFRKFEQNKRKFEEMNQKFA